MAHPNGNNQSVLDRFLKVDILKGLKGLVIDGVVDAVKQYQSKSASLVKIKATLWYIQGVQLLRRQTLVFALILFLVVMAALAIVIVPFILLAIAPWTQNVKWTVALLLGLADIAVPLLLLARLFSEKRWMRFTKSNELLENALK